MRNPGRRGGDDARAGSIGPTAPQAASDGGPADDELVGMRASDAPRTTEPHTVDHAVQPGNDDVGSDLDGDVESDLDGDQVDDLDFDLDADPADMDDDLLFDPLLSDEPIDLAAVRADDALIDALSGGGLAGADDLADDDPLIAMLAAWAASARPEPAAAAHPTDPNVAASGPAPRLRPVTAAPTDETVAVEATAGDHPDALTPNTRSPGGEAFEDDAPDTGAAEQDEADGLAERRPDLDPPTVRLTGPRRRTAGQRPATPDTVRPSLAQRLPADHGPLGRPGDGPGDGPRMAATATASVATLLSRVRTAGRTRPPGQALPPGHPLRRAAVAVVVAALGISGAAASGGTAQPGDPAWAITKVFFSERAESIEAAQVVSAGLERAQVLLSERQPELARQKLEAIAALLPSVRKEEGHDQLVDQKRMLEAVAALTPPLPSDPNLTSTTTPSRQADPGTSVLAQGAPGAAGKDKAAPPVVAKPADPATGSTGATAGTTTGGAGTGNTSGSTGTTSTRSSGSTGTSGTGTTSTTSTGTSGSQTGTGSTAVGPTGTGTGTGTGGKDTALAGSVTGPAAHDTAPAGTDGGTANDTTLAESATGGLPVVPAPAPPLDAARSAGASGTPADGTTTSESLPSTTTAPETATPTPATPPTADEPAPVTVLSAPEQASADGTGNPSADAPKVSAAGSAPAVSADAAGPAESSGAVVPSPVRTPVETGVVPEPVNVATPPTTTKTTETTTRTTETTTQTTETSDEPATADRASSSDTTTGTPTHTAAAGGTPEPVHVTADDNGGQGSSPSGSDSGSNSGSGGGRDSGSGSNNGSGSGNSGSGKSGSDDSGSDTGGPGGARTSAAVSIHP